MKCAILLVILMVTVGFIYGTQSAIRNCADLTRPCARRLKTAGRTLQFETICSCSNFGNTYYCDTEGKSNSALTWTTTEDGNIQDQIMFCERKERSCNDGETAATIMENWFYNYLCTCPSHHMELHAKEWSNEQWTSIFKCHKETCLAHNSTCQKIYMNDDGSYRKRLYVCTCPVGSTCPEHIYDFIESDRAGAYYRVNCRQ